MVGENFTTDLDKLYGIDNSPTAPDGLESAEMVVIMPLEQIEPFKNHPYNSRENDPVTQGIIHDLENGHDIESPAIVRPKPNGKYEMIAGHRRLLASQIAGKSALKVIIRDYSDEDATIAMHFSNKQREYTSPSERARVLAMTYGAMEKKQGQRTLVHDEPKLDIYQRIADREELSRSQALRWVHCGNHLIREFIDAMDSFNNQKGIGLVPAYELSFIDQESQKVVYDAMLYFDCKPTVSQAKQIRADFEKGEFSEDNLKLILSQEKPNQKAPPQNRWMGIAEKVAPALEKLYGRELTEDEQLKFIEDAIASKIKREQKQLNKTALAR